MQGTGRRPVLRMRLQTLSVGLPRIGRQSRAGVHGMLPGGGMGASRRGAGPVFSGVDFRLSWNLWIVSSTGLCAGNEAATTKCTIPGASDGCQYIDTL